MENSREKSVNFGILFFETISNIDKCSVRKTTRKKKRPKLLKSVMKKGDLTVVFVKTKRF